MFVPKERDELKPFDRRHAKMTLKFFLFGNTCNHRSPCSRHMDAFKFNSTKKPFNIEQPKQIFRFPFRACSLLSAKFAEKTDAVKAGVINISLSLGKSAQM